MFPFDSRPMICSRCFARPAENANPHSDRRDGWLGSKSAGRLG